MSKTMKNLKNRMRAPRDLKEAAKKGERLTRTYYADTPAANARKFALAFAGYACVAALLLGSVIVLPSLMNGQTPVAQSGTVPTVDTDYVYPSGEQLGTYVRPDLIWANEENPQLKDFVIWSAYRNDQTVTVTQSMTLPKLSIENARYAIEFKMELLADTTDKSAISSMRRKFVAMESALENCGAKAIGNLGVNEDNYCFNVYEIGAEQLNETAQEELVSAFKSMNGEYRIEIKIAWQPYDQLNPADYQIRCIWQAKQENGEQTVWSMVPDDHFDQDYYIVRFCVEDVSSALDPELQKDIQAKFDEFLKDLNAVGTPTDQLNDYPYRGENRYFYYHFVMSKKDLLALDTESVVAQMSNVDGDIWCHISVFDYRFR